MDLPTIEKNLCDFLDEDIKIEEIADAIASLKTGKAPGPEGFPSDFYKAFSKLLCPVLLSVFLESLQNSKLPTTFYQAIISLILKKDKPPLDCTLKKMIFALCSISLIKMSSYNITLGKNGPNLILLNINNVI